MGVGLNLKLAALPPFKLSYSEVPRNYSWNLFLFVVSESFVQQMCLCFGLLDKLETAFLV